MWQAVDECRAVKSEILEAVHVGYTEMNTIQYPS
jgi:hypothetical protein